MGIVALKGVEVFGRIGVTADERLVGRKFLVDVEIRVPLKAASQSDALEDVLNYEILAKAIYHQLEAEFRLLEAAARAIGEEALEKIPGIAEMKIRMHKLSPLMKGNIESAIVEWCYPEDY
jgi:dihydroneopterin aldolase